MRISEIILAIYYLNKRIRQESKKILIAMFCDEDDHTETELILNRWNYRNWGVGVLIEDLCDKCFP